jgi:hypothetical protein
MEGHSSLRPLSVLIRQHMLHPPALPHAGKAAPHHACMARVRTTVYRRRKVILVPEEGLLPGGLVSVTLLLSVQVMVMVSALPPLTVMFRVLPLTLQVNVFEPVAVPERLPVPPALKVTTSGRSGTVPPVTSQVPTSELVGATVVVAVVVAVVVVLLPPLPLPPPLPHPKTKLAKINTIVTNK